MTIGALAAPLLLVGSLVAQEPTVAVRAGRLIDGTGARPVENAVVLIQGGRIVAVGPSVAIPQGAEVLDLSGYTVLPGFIDAHTHLAGRVIGDGDWQHSTVLDDAADAALYGALHARQTLEAGFTTVRNVGNAHFADLALRDAIAAGRVPGPRILGAGPSFGITGGHCDPLAGYALDVFAEGPLASPGAADGTGAIRFAVRRNVKFGADVIKVCATGGVLSPTDSVGVQQYTEEELRTVVEVAAMLERKVAAHAHGNAGIKAAVRAGVASIEHGSILDEEAIALMREHGTYLVPTLMAAEAVERLAREGRLPPTIADKALAIAPIMRRSFRMAVEGGVRIALGTDAGVFPHGTNGREFTLMVEQGMTPLQAIVAGTSAAADLLGVSATVGTIAAGRRADIVGVRGDPLSDVTVLERVDFVMQNGRVFKQNGRVLSRTARDGR